jgi:hypothetical protein
MLTAAYFKTLVDPFENAAPKLGWGCMVPSQVTQGYARFNEATNADGSIAIIVLPCITSGIQVNNSGSTGVTWVPASYGNGPAINANFSEGRVVSVGVRVVPDLAMTSPPGAIYTGATVASNWNNVLSLSPNDFKNLPTTHMSRGYDGGSSTGRPVDPDSFTFFTYVVNASGFGGDATSQDASLPFSVPYIVYQASTSAAIQMIVEVVINIEATQIIGHTVSTIMPDDGNAQPRLCDYWPSFESMWGRIRNSLPHPGRAGEAAAASDESYISALLSGVGSVGRQGAYQAGRLVGSSLFGATFGLGREAVRYSQQRISPQFAGYLQ